MQTKPSLLLDAPTYVDSLRRGAVRTALAEKVAITPAGYPGFETLLRRC